MRTWNILAALVGLALVTITACGGSSGSTPNGGACADAKACEGSVCLTSGDFPGGYCSMSCSLSDPKSCPSGSVCIDDASGAPSGVKSVCYQTCNDTKDCRSGYQCAEKANQKVCRNGG